MMTNPHGSHIWYELLTADIDGARAFYEPLLGWKIDAEPAGEMDYRMIAAADGLAGGAMQITAEMAAHGARPVWLGYIGVDDVDETVDKLLALGGKVLMPAMDIPDVGRMAMVADPQGVPFYVMRGASDETSHAYEGGAGVAGHVNWNELSTSDPDAAFDFYAALFGWEKGEGMDMGAMGTYQMLDLGGQSFGAVTAVMPEGAQPKWTYYIRVPDIDAAQTRVEAGGGTIHYGPAAIPGDEYIIIGDDPQGAAFALVGPRIAAA